MSKPTDQMQAVLDAHKALAPLPIEKLEPEAARQMPLLDRAAMIVYGQHFTNRALAPNPLPVGKVEHILIPGSRGDIPARIYTPKGDAPEGGWPVLVYYHGGGWVIAMLDTYDASARALCDAAHCIVLSVHYRQAPEHKWPAAPEDAFDAYRWATSHARNFHGNPARIAVAGESAGGNLATVVCFMARDNKAPMPLHQLLIYPVTDLYQGFDSESAKKHSKAKPLNTAMLPWFYDYYLPRDADRLHAYISPLHARDLSGLPPATVISAEIDPLRSEGEAYAKKLEAAGIPTRWKLYSGVTHEFFGLKGLVDAAGEAVSFAAEGLKKAFEHKAPPAGTVITERKPYTPPMVVPA